MHVCAFMEKKKKKKQAAQLEWTMEQAALEWMKKSVRRDVAGGDGGSRPSK